MKQNDTVSQHHFGLNGLWSTSGERRELMGQPPTLLWPWSYIYVYGFGHQIMGTSVRNVSLSGYFDLFDLRMKHVLGIVHAHIQLSLLQKGSIQRHDTVFILQERKGSHAVPSDENLPPEGNIGNDADYASSLPASGCHDGATPITTSVSSNAINFCPAPDHYYY